MSGLFGPRPGDEVYDHMVELRREVHRRPELAFAEHHTTGLIRDHMAGLGIEESVRVTDTGGIFTMEGGRPGSSVVLRADIDALRCRRRRRSRGAPRWRASCTPAVTMSTWR